MIRAYLYLWFDKRLSVNPNYTVISVEQIFHLIASWLRTQVIIREQVELKY